jgi:hypothetical protein
MNITIWSHVQYDVFPQQNRNLNYNINNPLNIFIIPDMTGKQIIDEYFNVFNNRNNFYENSNGTKIPIYFHESVKNKFMIHKYGTEGDGCLNYNDETLGSFLTRHNLRFGNDLNIYCRDVKICFVKFNDANYYFAFDENATFNQCKEFAKKDDLLFVNKILKHNNIQIPLNSNIKSFINQYNIREQILNISYDVHDENAINNYFATILNSLNNILRNQQYEENGIRTNSDSLNEILSQVLILKDAVM